jgi:N-acetylglutamate synthase-like GNAT family acetyltransferase
VGDRIIASIFAYAESPKNVVISSICCDKHYRKQGIGTQLLYVIEKNAARMQFLSVTLAVDAQGEEFFAKNGYERILELDKEKIYQKHFKDTIMNAN